MVRRFSSLFFRQGSQDRVAQAATDNRQAAASHPGLPPNPIQRTDFPRKTVRHVKSSGALLGTLRSLQYKTQPPVPPLPKQSARGLGDLQECFWLGDSLSRTTAQLDRCSNQLDEIHGSAIEVRRELEGIQIELELLQRKVQLGVEPARRDEEPRSEQPRSDQPKPIDICSIEPTPLHPKRMDPKLTDPPTDAPTDPPTDLKAANLKPTDLKQTSPKPVDPAPKRPVVVKASSIQQRIQFFSKIANN